MKVPNAWKLKGAEGVNNILGQKVTFADSELTLLFIITS